MEFRLLGPVEACSAGRPLALGHAQRRAVLAVLALDLGRVVGADRLISRVWGIELPPSARNALHGHVARLRAVIGAAAEPGVALERQAGGYLLAAPAGSTDVLQFRKLAGEAAAAGDDERAESLLRSAAGLWRGPALDGVSSPWLDRARAGLEQERQALLLRQYETGLRLGRHDALTGELAEAAASAPADEGLAGLLMLALYRSGRAAEALRWFERVRQSLAEELGADPGPSLRRLHEQILHSDPSLDWHAPPRPAGHAGPIAPPPADPAASAAAPRSPAPTPRELPADVSAFTGRAEELAELDRLAGAAAAPPGAVLIAAVSGTAGVGKTALAVRWAHRAAGQFPDGQLYINLRGYDPGQPVAPADGLAVLLQSLGVAASDIPADEDARAARYRSLLAGRRMLVVLDNAGSAEQVRPLLPGAPGCRALVTSRDALAGLVARDGAQRLDLDLLPHSEAAELLTAVIGPRAERDPAGTRLLAQQCARLPLALRVAAELAVSRPGLAIADLAAELADERQRLELLDADGDPRTSVRAVFSWSCRHLRDDAIRCFALLGLHPGPDVEPYAVAALAGVTLAQATRLLDVLERAHLIIQSAPVSPGRYALHDLLRAYARELAASRETAAGQQEAATRLLDHYLATAAAAMSTLYPAERQNRLTSAVPAALIPPVAEAGLARAWVEEQRACLAAAVGFAVAHGWPSHAAQLAGLMYRDLFARGHLALTATILGQALTAARLLGDRAAEITALIDLGAAEMFRSCEDARRHLRQALALAAEAGDHAAQARALGNLGNVDLGQCRYQEAADSFTQALAMAQKAGNNAAQIMALMNLGTVRTGQGRPGEALDYEQQALAIARETGDTWYEARAQNSAGHCAVALGRYQEAAGHFRRGLRLARAMGNHIEEAFALGGLGRIQSGRGRQRQAAALLGRAVTLLHDVGDHSSEAEMRSYLDAALSADGQPSQALKAGL